MLSSFVAPLSIERLHNHENEVAIAFVDSVTRRQLKSKRGVDVQGDMTHRESHLPPHMNKAFYVYLYRRPIEERAIKRPQRHDDEGVHLFRVPKSQLRDDDHPASHLLGGLGQVRVAFLPNGVEFAWKFLFMPRDQLKRRVQEGTVLPRGGQDEL